MLSTSYLEIVLQVLPQLIFAVLAGVSLVFALRWPLVRGKHPLCAFLSIILASSTLNILHLFIIMTGGLTSGDFLLTVLLIVLRGMYILSAVLLVCFVAVLGTELRRRQSEYPDVV